MNTTAETARGPAGLETDTHTYRRVYIWHWPIRAMHWIAALSLVVLVATGFYIGKPYFVTGGEASSHFLMGWMRFLHFAAAGAFVATAIIRIYWLFRGNKFERWTALFPVKKQDWVNMIRIAKHYLMMDRGRGPHYLGHNPMQQMSYTFIYMVAAVQVVTGFYMYGLSDPGGFFFTAFAWVGSLLGGAQMVRFVHHVMTWVFLIFIPIHIYLSLRIDVMDREATISSIISGSRWVRSGTTFEDE